MLIDFANRSKNNLKSKSRGFNAIDNEKNVIGWAGLYSQFSPISKIVFHL